jgi:hypothetical protein
MTSPTTCNYNEGHSLYPDLVKLNTMSMFHLSTSSIIETMKNSSCCQSLPKDYEPNDFDIFCGRGKGYYNMPGNRKFREILLECLPRYSSLSSRMEKTIFLTDIIEIVRSRSNGQAKFIRLTHTGFWEELSDDQAREKVGHALREAKEPRYKMRLTECKRKVKQKSNVQSEVKASEAELLKKIDSSNLNSFFQNQQKDYENTLHLPENEDLFEPLPISSASLSFTNLPNLQFSSMDLPIYAKGSVERFSDSSLAVA